MWSYDSLVMIDIICIYVCSCIQEVQCTFTEPLFMILCKRYIGNIGVLGIYLPISPLVTLMFYSNGCGCLWVILIVLVCTSRRNSHPNTVHST